MTRLVLERRNLELEYITDCLLIRQPDHPPRSLPLRRIRQIICMHNVKLTTQLIGQLHARGIDLVVLNQRYEQNSFALYADQQKIVERRCQQYIWQSQPHTRLPLAAFWIQKKAEKSQAVAEVCQLPLDSHFFNQIIKQIQQAPTEAQLRGMEGWLQRNFFEAWRSKIDPALGFTQRVRRPPTDPVNAALSLAYTLVHQEAVRQCKAHGLDSQLGFFHRTCFGRHSLACDLMEPVRPRIEAWIFNLFAGSLLDKRYFRTSRTGCLLGKQGREIFYELYEEQWPGFTRQLRAAAYWLARIMDQEAHHA